MVHRFIVTAVLTGCAAAPDVATVDQPINGCSAGLCGGNSPVIANFGVFNFNTAGLRNEQDFKILGMTQGTTAYDVVVRDSRIEGWIRGKPVLVGRALAGARIWIERYGPQYAIEIADAKPNGFTELVATNPQPLETYVLDWSDVTGNALPGPLVGGDVIEKGLLPIVSSQFTGVCSMPPDWSTYGNPDSPDETTWMYPLDSVVFEGDVINAHTRTIDPVPDDTWFNIGCASHTLAKMRVTRNTIHTAPTWEQAQATLKMFSADYCGRGHAFTVEGEPIVWRDRTNFDYWKPPRSLEARWSYAGALCLDTPRLLDTKSAEATAEFPDIWQAINNECSLPACDDPDANKWSPLVKEMVTSANYD